MEAMHEDGGLEVAAETLQLRQVFGVAGRVCRGVGEIEERHCRAAGIGHNQLVQRLHKVLWYLW